MNPKIPSSSSSFKRTPSIRDVAEALGIHKSTVSLGLSGKGNISKKTRERIIRVAREMDYHPNPLAQRLATNATNNQVILCARSLDVGITTEKLLLIQKGLAERGFETPIYSLSNDGQGREEHQAKQVRQLCRQQPRAIVCSTHAIHESAFPELDEYKRNGGILIAYDAEIPLDCDQVMFDREDNAYQAARTLINAGHHDIGLALATPRHKNGQLFLPQNARVQGFKRALGEASLPFHPEWIFEAGLDETAGETLASCFLSLPHRPTGLCIVNDYLALGFMVTVIRTGLRVPHDLSLIGHDNQVIATHCPTPLTCATHPKHEIAEAVINLLTERLSGSQKTSQTIHIRSQIIKRKSIGVPLFS